MKQQQRSSQKMPISDFQNILRDEDSQSIAEKGQEAAARQKEAMLNYKLEKQEKRIQEDNMLDIKEIQQFYTLLNTQFSKRQAQTLPQLTEGTLKISQFKYYTFEQQQMEIEPPQQAQDESFDKHVLSQTNNESQKQKFVNACIELSRKKEYPKQQDIEDDVIEVFNRKRLTMHILRKQLRDKLRNKLVYESYINRLNHQCTYQCQEQDCSQCLDLIRFIYKEKLQRLDSLYYQKKKTLLKSFLSDFYPIIFDESYLKQDTIIKKEQPMEDQDK